jgi:hypothetical protein
VVPKDKELFFKEGNNAMVMHSQFRNVFVRWDINFHKLRTISSWNDKTIELEEDSRTGEI